MTNIGATAISTQATMITSSAAAMDLFSILNSVTVQEQPCCDDRHTPAYLGRTAGLSHQILQRRAQLAKTERVPAGPEFSRFDPLAGEQQFFRGHLAESQPQRKL